METLRPALRAVAIITGVFVMLILGVLVWLWHAIDPSRDAVATAESPDSRFMATLFEVNGGATTSFGYTVVVVPTAKPSEAKEVASLYGATRSASAFGANLRWASSSELLIEYMDAKSTMLKVPRLSVEGAELTIALRPGTVDVAAPPGGMLYNLRGSNL